MDSTHIWTIIFLIILILLSGIFSCIEAAYLSANKIRIRTMAEEGNKSAKVAETLFLNSDRLFSSILVVNNLLNIGASSLTTVLVIELFGEGIAVAYATGILTLCILIFGEITPKNLATRNADKLSMFFAPFLKLTFIIFSPIVIVLNIVSSLFIKLFGKNIDVGPTMTEEELKTIVTVGHEEGVLEDEEKEMIHNVFEFAETEIKEIMTPRIHVVGVADDCSYEQLMEVYQQSRYSRYPIHSESFDEIIGVLNVKDLLFSDIDVTNFDIKNHMRDIFVVYEFNQVSDVFAAMRKEHATLAIVLDEYGVMSGIVTFEDIVEEIVGEIDDEYDDHEEELITETGENEYLVDGSLGLNDVNDALQTTFDSEDFESIGGLVLGQFSGVPKVGDDLILGNVSFSIVKMHKNRIAQLKVMLLEEEETTE